MLSSPLSDSTRKPEDWKRPTLHTTASGAIHFWDTRLLRDVPTSDAPDEETREYFTGEAKQFMRVPDDQSAPWGWVCRIHVRYPALDVPPKLGVQMKPTWITASAWLVPSAHAPSEPGQWFVTSAHNVLGPTYEHDENGRMTGYKPASALADAIYLEAVWGHQVYSAWVDKVAIMKGYYDDVRNIHLDGAALHIKDSTIPPAFWQNAPPPVALTMPLASTTTPFLIAGYPGGVNSYPELRGLYLTGHNTEPRATAPDGFQPVAVKSATPGKLKEDQLMLKYEGVSSPEGFSGGPVMVGAQRRVVAVAQTDGLGALLVTRNGVGVDLVSLIEAVGRPGVELPTLAL